MDKKKEGQARWREANRQYLREAAQKYRLANPNRSLHAQAKHRARKLGLDFSIDVEDIAVPAECPVLGIELVMSLGKASDNSPSLDRIDNSKGYIQGNIKVISWKANRLKSDASVEEFEKVLEYMKST